MCCICIFNFILSLLVNQIIQAALLQTQQDQHSFWKLQKRYYDIQGPG